MPDAINAAENLPARIYDDATINAAIIVKVTNLDNFIIVTTLYLEIGVLHYLYFLICGNALQGREIYSIS